MPWIICKVLDENKAVKAVGLDDEEGILPVEEIWARIDEKEEFYTEVDEKSRPVNAVEKDGRKYLTTHEDGVTDNNLEELKECRV